MPEKFLADGISFHHHKKLLCCAYILGINRAKGLRIMSMYYRKKKTGGGGAARGSVKGYAAAATRVPGTAGKAKLAAARNASKSAQMARYVGRRSNVPGKDNHTFDPVVLNTNYLQCDNATAVAVSASGYITPGSSAIVLNQVSQGTSSTQRIGRKILMTAIHIRAYLRNTTASADLNMVRVALVYIPEMDRTTTTMPPQNAIWTSQDARELRVIDNADRFKVVRQWTFMLLGDADACATGSEAFAIDEYVKLNLPTCWLKANTDGSFNSMEKGGLCLYVQGSSALIPVLFPVIRLYFEDQ
ncbi:putative capsid protein [Lake Sarah-associated circular virus-43]|uniref:putative capsid protein n=1 Tax=Lake Sarah-associated circular virus-43 TaxID=1685772 RepID=UPI00077768E8|nr:putative capsid protein [Lake Sarah-associated circular virus-43]ALE29791.1 putative capsid protein [Lake Sarah-associated circular virus-43]